MAIASAAGLRARHLDRAARLFEQLDRGKADRRPEQIDQTREEQGYPHPISLYSWLLRI
jgi:hypothetical protein